MPRALTIERRVAGPAGRDAAVAAMRSRRVAFAAAECRYWVFEEPASPGTFVEFVEADSAARLAAAFAASGAAVPPVLSELELS
jgi:hypothetical protein